MECPSCNHTVRKSSRFCDQCGQNLQDKKIGDPDTSKVFISHSHYQREEAVYFMHLLEKNGAKVFLDQNSIQGEDYLPNSIIDGINWCDTLLLLWSYESSNSEWVLREVEEAINKRKKIIPYLNDSSKLPEKLQQFVFIDSSDKNRTNSALLKAIFGNNFRPINPNQLFPGDWIAEVSHSGMSIVKYDIELRTNGQIKGVGNFENTGIGGLITNLANDIGASPMIAGVRLNLQGNWTYDEEQGALILEVRFSLWGQETFGKIVLQTDGKNRGPIKGQCCIVQQAVKTPRITWPKIPWDLDPLSEYFAETGVS